MKKIILIISILLLGSLNFFSQQGTAPLLDNYSPVIIDNSPVMQNNTSPNVTRHFISDDGSFTAMIEPNIRLFPTSNYQSDPHVSVWSTNSNYIIVSSTTIPPPKPMHVGYYSTTNGGLNWFGTDSMTIGTGESAGLAVVSYNQPGTIFYNYEVYTPNWLLGTDRSTNYGANWVGRVVCPTTGQLDPEEMTIDVTPTSLYFGRIYVVLPYWFSPYTSSLTYSTNNGISFTPQQIIGSPISGHFEQSQHTEVDKNGIVYCTWEDNMNGSPYTAHSIGITKSTNGGVNWSTPTRILTINGARGYYLSTGIRGWTHPTLTIDRSGGPRNNWLYITWCQKQLAPAGDDPDICFSRSSNGGLNWSAPVRVNNDPINNGRVQLFSSIAVDQVTGSIGIAFFDTRDVVSPNDSVNTYIAVSNNGGDTWQNIKVSDLPHKPEAPAGWNGWYTLHTAVSMNNNIIRVFWPDKRSGPVQIYTSIINITGNKKLTEQVPETYSLYQNYPNPFNPVTKIRFDIAKPSFTKLVVFDALGREVAVLVNEELKPGTHEVGWDGLNYPSGVYFYKLTAGEFTQTKKMILLK